MARSTYTPPKYLPGRGVIGARVRRTTTQAVATATTTPVSFDSSSPGYNPVGMWSSTTNPTRITILVAGWYIVTGDVRWDVVAADVSLVTRIRVNGSTSISSAESNNMNGVGAVAQVVTTLYQFAKDDYVELTAFQASGGSVNLLVINSACPSFGVHYLGY